MKIAKGFALGLEGLSASAAGNEAAVLDYLRKRAFCFTARYVLTPDTSPALYLSAGAGRMSARFKLKLANGEETALSSPLYFIGAGARYELGAGWKADLSVRLTYQARTNFDFLLHYPSPYGIQGALFINKSF